MQVFIVGSPLETAKALSKRHLNNQINEASIILDALNGAKAWSYHPCVLQYRGREEWLRAYKACLEWYVRGDEDKALWASNLADYWRPKFHTEQYFSNMKARLYTKGKEHYKQWAYLGTSEENWYWSQEQGEWRKYVNGKRI
jgi:hypothetical protein